MCALKLRHRWLEASLEGQDSGQIYASPRDTVAPAPVFASILQSEII